MAGIEDLFYYEAQQAIEAMKNQLIIVLVNRLGGKIEVPVSEIDETGVFNLVMRLNTGTRAFYFEVTKKDDQPPG